MVKSRFFFLESDLDEIWSDNRQILESLKGRKILVTGATGFFGKWILLSLLYANEKFNIDVEVHALSRSAQKFLSTYPQFKDFNRLQFHSADILDRRALAEIPPVDIVIHAATSASDLLNRTNPLLMLDTISIGTRNILDWSVKSQIKYFHFVSSGAVYGQFPKEITTVSETYTGAPDPTNPLSTYGEGKRVGELMCSVYQSQHKNTHFTISRCFAFLGPFLPLNTHFAVGNFLNDALSNRIIEVKGPPQTIRSYLYPSDLLRWMYSIIFNGKSLLPYNLGSDKCVTIKELAQTISNIAYGTPDRVHFANNLSESSSYAPNTDLLQHELNLKIQVPLELSIQKTMDWNRKFHT